jgi:hypothetical protein
MRILLTDTLLNIHLFILLFILLFLELYIKIIQLSRINIEYIILHKIEFSFELYV